MGSVHVKTSVSLMLGSVVNTLEQRGEWLNGGRGAAKGMIDRLSANQVTPFGAAEHLEFWSRRWSGGLREWFLVGSDGEEACKNDKGLHSRTWSLHESALYAERGRGRADLYAPIQAPATGKHAPVWSHASSLARLKKPTRQGLHLQRPGREHFTIISLRVGVQYGAHSSPTHFFCLSVGFPKFVSEREREKNPCVVCPRRLQGAHGARVMLWQHKTALQPLCCYTKAPSKCSEITADPRISFY